MNATACVENVDVQPTKRLHTFTANYLTESDYFPTLALMIDVFGQRHFLFVFAERVSW